MLENLFTISSGEMSGFPSFQKPLSFGQTMNIPQLYGRAESLTTTEPQFRPALKPFFEMLKFVDEESYRGACHATSSVLYVLLSELKMEPTICIGELGREGICFDHSWIEIAGKVFDVAVALPDDSKFGSPPVFMSRNLENLGEPYWQYGITSGIGDDPFVDLIKAGSFADYMDNAPFHKNGLWHFVQKFGRRCGLAINLNQTRQRYANVKWKSK